MNDIMKIIEALENSGILLKGVSKTIENETKEQKGGFLSMLLGTLGASLLGNLLTGGKGIVRAGEGFLTAEEGIKNIYFDSFGVEHILKEIKKIIRKKDIKTNIFRIEAYNSIMCGYFCIGFIDFIFSGKTLIDFTGLFSPYDFEKNNKIILKYFKNE